MLTNNAAIRWLKKQEHNEAWYVVIFTKPSLYLYNLLRRTVFMGVFLFLMYELLIKYFGVKDQAIPSTLHSLIGIVIGLLLVFRTNTAYDRWWEARKIFSSLQAALIYISIKTQSDKIAQVLKKINTSIFEYISIITVGDLQSAKVKEEFMESYCEISDILKTENIDPIIQSHVEKRLVDILEYFSALERIKDTPIPASYSFHIKLSVFAYLLTLPFGLFFGLGLWSIPLVMILFFIIAGIEIISNEIENPFRGDPNDLPIDKFKQENEKFIYGRREAKEIV
jgi:ion channel-forming bestrophin family protein